MKNTFKVVSIVLVAVFVFSAATCFGQSGSGSSGGGGRTINSAEDLKKYLDSQPANGPDKPIRVSMAANGPMLPKIAEAIRSAGKYVSLTLTGNVLTSIPEGAFYDEKTDKGCETLVGITIPNSVTSIGSYAFYESGLTSITIPDSVTDIEEEAFAYCRSLTSITLGSGITDFDWENFLWDDAYLENLSEINVDAANTKYSSQDGVLFNKNKTTLIRCPTGKKGAYTIPASVTSIEGWSFWKCRDITSITFQSTISSNNFDSDAFYGLGDLRAKYLTGGKGTYTRASNSSTWTKQ